MVSACETRIWGYNDGHIFIVIVRVIIVVLYMFSLLFVRVINVIIVIVRVINDVYVFIVIVRVIDIYILEIPLQHDAFERRASAQAVVRNQLKHTGHYLEFRPEDRVGLVSGRIRCWIKKAFHCLVLWNARRKFERELMSSCIVWMMIVSWYLDVMQGAKRRGLQKLTVQCQEFARWFAWHQLIGLVSSLY